MQIASRTKAIFDLQVCQSSHQNKKCIHQLHLASTEVIEKWTAPLAGSGCRNITAYIPPPVLLSHISLWYTVYDVFCLGICNKMELSDGWCKSSCSVVNYQVSDPLKFSCHEVYYILTEHNDTWIFLTYILRCLQHHRYSVCFLLSGWGGGGSLLEQERKCTHTHTE